MALFGGQIVILDTETSGLPRDPWARVIEIGLLLLDADGQEIDSYSALVRPEVLDERVESALAVSGISRDDLIASQNAFVREPKVRGFFERHGWPWVTSYNVPFDREMMQRTWPEITERLRWARCIMSAAMGIMGPAGELRPADPSHYRYDAKRPWLYPKLTDAARYFGAEAAQTHRAIDDCRMAAAVAREVRRREIND